MERFALSERQADDILEIRLRQLARLEAIRIEQELKSLRADAEKLDEILKSPATLKRTLIREIEADAKAHGDDRRTLILEQKRTVLETRVVDEPVTVVVSLKGWIRALKGHEVEPGQLAFKAGDGLYGTFACRTVDALLVFGSNGRVYSAPVGSLPSGRGDGQPITSIVDIEPGTQPAHYFAGKAGDVLLLAGTGGFGLMARAGDLLSRQRGGKSFLALEDDEKPLPPVALFAGATRVACLTLSGRLLVFGVDELKLQSNGGRGLTLIDLDGKDAVVSVAVFADALRVLGTGRGGKEREEVLRNAALDAYVGKRARKGRRQDVMPKAMRVVAATGR
jgi:topoisomerase-4 subunit A